MTRRYLLPSPEYHVTFHSPEWPSLSSTDHKAILQRIFGWYQDAREELGVVVIQPLTVRAPDLLHSHCYKMTNFIYNAEVVSFSTTPGQESL